MDDKSAAALLRSLIDRLDTGEKGRRQLVGYISGNEFQALELALRRLEGVPPDDREEDGGQGEGARGDPPPPPRRTFELKPVPNGAVDNPEVLLCLDFGTAMSKAFAMRGEDDDPHPMWIEIGSFAAAHRPQEDTSPSSLVVRHAVPSVMLIDSGGDVFLGVDALDRSAADDTHPRFDSLKEYMIAADEGRSSLFSKKVKDLVPPGVDLTFGEALLLYLAYLTDMALGACARDHGTGRNVRRRFALPAWREQQAAWATDVLPRELARAHLVANALHGRWGQRWNLAELRPLLKAAAEVPTDSLPLHLIDRGVLEPLAAGASRMTPGSEGRSFLAVVDVGAGTTDFGMFRLQTGPDGKWRAYPIKGTTDILRRAGNALDRILITMLRDRLGGAGGAVGESRSWILQNRSRVWKEQLFETGVLAVTVVDHPIRITREEFLAHPQCVEFATQIREKFLAMLGKVSQEGYNLHAPMGVGLLATGGGATLPMVKSLLDLRVPQGSGTLVIAEARGMPDYLLEDIDERRHAELNQAYPQLAVAIGGSSPFYADPRHAIDGNVAPRAAVGAKVEYKNDSHQ